MGQHSELAAGPGGEQGCAAAVDHWGGVALGLGEVDQLEVRRLACGPGSSRSQEPRGVNRADNAVWERAQTDRSDDVIPPSHTISHTIEHVVLHPEDGVDLGVVGLGRVELHAAVPAVAAAGLPTKIPQNPQKSRGQVGYSILGHDTA